MIERPLQTCTPYPTPNPQPTTRSYLPHPSLPLGNCLSLRAACPVSFVNVLSFLVDKKKACERLKLLLATVSHKPLTCDMECCTEDLCNTMVPQTTRHTFQSHTTPAVYYYSRAPENSIQVVVSVVLASLTLALM